MDVCLASVVGGTCWRPTLRALTLYYGKESTVGTIRIGVHSITWFKEAKEKYLF